MRVLEMMLMATTRVADDDVSEKFLVELQKGRAVLIDGGEPEEITTQRVQTHLAQVDQTTSISGLENVEDIVGVDVLKQITLTSGLETLHQIAISKGQHRHCFLGVGDRDVTRVEVAQEVFKGRDVDVSDEDLFELRLLHTTLEPETRESAMTG